MSDDDEYPTAEELAQHERNQHDPAWLEWLAGMDDALRIFFAEDVPGMPADPYTEAGLRHAELAALRCFPTPRSARRPANTERANRFCRYLGETFVRNLEGRWVNVVREDSTGRPAIDVPGFIYIDVMELLESAIWQDRNGEAWTYVFGGVSEYHVDWAQHGRMHPLEWHKYRAQRDLDLAHRAALAKAESR